MDNCSQSYIVVLSYAPVSIRIHQIRDHAPMYHYDSQMVIDGFVADHR